MCRSRLAISGAVVAPAAWDRQNAIQPVERAMANVRKIYERTHEVFAIAERDGIPCYRAADRLAEARIEALTAVRLLG